VWISSAFSIQEWGIQNYGNFFSADSPDAPITLHLQDANSHGRQISVDLRLRCHARGEDALVEVKWSRGGQFVVVKLLE